MIALMSRTACLSALGTRDRSLYALELHVRGAAQERLTGIYTERLPIAAMKSHPIFLWESSATLNGIEIPAVFIIETYG